MSPHTILRPWTVQTGRITPTARPILVAQTGLTTRIGLTAQTIPTAKVTTLSAPTARVALRAVTPALSGSVG
ncbi:hypothetical protein [Nonomuraea solani]|uniref:hypothetical protein n=1 Tax=Nonomuraea solani TaxID=1144553 RepID=UPI00135C6302|nr:hypothetical protein [Nonomuraea solani]